MKRTYALFLHFLFLMLLANVAGFSQTKSNTITLTNTANGPKTVMTTMSLPSTTVNRALNVAGANSTFSTTAAATGSCPANISVGNDPGKCGAIVNYAKPTCLPKTYTQSGSNEVTAGTKNSDGSCARRGFRVYDLPASGIMQGFTVSSVDYAVILPNGLPVTVNIYQWKPATPLSYANFTLVGSASTTLPAVSYFNGVNGFYLFNQPVTAVIAPNYAMVVEIAGTGDNFFIGGNFEPETGPSYMRTCDGGIQINSDEKLIINPTGCAGGQTITQVQGLGSGSLFPVGTTVNTFKSSDGADCSFSVTVNDNEPPAFTAPPAQNVALGANCSVVVPNLVTALSGTDNCGGTVTFTQLPLAGAIVSAVHNQAITVTITAKDGHGNTNPKSVILTAKDNTLPAVTAPAAVSVSTSVGQCSAANVALGTPTYSDNCSGATLSNNAPPVYSKGITTVTWTATDAAGNKATATQNVTVQDNEAPVVGNLPVVTAECSVTVSPTNGTDNCAGPVTPSTSDLVTYSAQGTYIIHWTYSDGNGNSTLKNQTVTIKDVTKPVPVITNLPAITGAGSVTVSNKPTATDNCAGTITATTNSPLSYSVPGTYSITWSYSDGAGNVSTQVQQVNVTAIIRNFIVTNTNNAGDGSLRQAILNANATANSNAATPDTISFNIPGTGVQVISPLSALPTLTESVFIDGWSQPGWTSTPLIEINGTSVPSSFGLNIQAHNCVVRGLAINRFPGPGNAAGIALFGNFSGNWIYGCHLGTDASGLVARPNGQLGMWIGGGQTNVRVGTNADGVNDALERNVLSANSFGHGILMQGSNGTFAGNYIGVGADGSTPLGNTSAGIFIQNGSGNTVGGSVAAARNVIAANTNGITVNNSNGNAIQGNYIGTKADGSTALGNTGNGILVNGTSTGNIVGGQDAGAENRIAFNGKGINIASGTAADIRRNSIYGNTSIGIDLGDNGFTANDAGDGDAGPNNLQNFPEVTQAKVESNGNVTVSYSVPSGAANAAYPLRIDFYTSALGQGRTYIGTQTYTGANAGLPVTQTFTPATAVNTGDQFVATATDANGNSSEFSTIFGSHTLVVTNTNNAGPGSLREALLNANLTPNISISVPDTILFNIPGSGARVISPLSAYPVITASVFIDGWSQPGWTSTPLIEINGAAVQNNIGLNIQAGNCTVRGLAINSFPFTSSNGLGIGMYGNFSGNWIYGCHVGTDASGLVARPNGQAGVSIITQANVLIGTNADGVNDALERNVISGNRYGILMRGTNSTFAGNYIGVGADGTTAIGNTPTGSYVGIYLLTGAANITIGGSAVAARNVVSFNEYGIVIQNTNGGNIVQGNYIGTKADGVTALGNIYSGVWLENNATGNTIGGTTANLENVIAYSDSIGINVVSGTGNTISRNSIYANLGVGIDLGYNYATANDPGDADGGANNLQNFPEIAQAQLEINGSLTVNYLVPSAVANSAYPLRIDFYKAQGGQGKTYLGTQTYTAASAGLQVSQTFLPGVALNPGDGVVATATDAAGNTSEFSANAVITNALTTYYPRNSATDLSQVSQWTTDGEGVGGTSPQNFTSPNQLFNINGNGTTPGVVAGPWTLSGGSNAIITASMELSPSARLTVGSGSEFNFNAKPVTIRSSAAGTASIGQISGSLINATNVTVERYIPARRAWRILSAPVLGSQSISSAWREGAVNTSDNPVPNYGTFITGGSIADGFDQNPGATASIKTYSSSVNNWVPVPNTNATPVGGSAYMTFVYGSRNTNNISVGLTPTNTTLRAKGMLRTGDQTFAVSASGFTAIPNPYPSPINFQTLTKTAVAGNFYLWDPKVGGLNGVGGYVTVSWNGSSYDVSSNAISPESQYIQSGQGFLVSATGAGASLTIKESDKVSAGSDNVFRTANGSTSETHAPVFADPTQGQGLRVSLQAVSEDKTATWLDEVFASYNSGYANKVDQWDAVKAANIKENLGMQREGQTLTIERKPLPTSGDTISLKLWNTERKSYLLQVNPVNIGSTGLYAYLEDKYLKTTVPLSLTEISQVSFSVTGDEASARADRFHIILTKSGKPVEAQEVLTKSSITAYPNPVVGTNLNLLFTNQPAGAYRVSLVNSAGAVVMDKMMQHGGGTAVHPLTLIRQPASGIYQLQIVGEKTKATIAIFSN